MRFDFKAYERAFPKQEKPKPIHNEEDVMTQEVPDDPVEEPEQKEEQDDGMGTDGKLDSE